MLKCVKNEPAALKSGKILEIGISGDRMAQRGFSIMESQEERYVRRQGSVLF